MSSSELLGDAPRDERASSTSDTERDTAAGAPSLLPSVPEADAKQHDSDVCLLEVSEPIPRVPFSRSSIRRFYVLDEQFFPSQLRLSDNGRAPDADSDVRVFLLANPWHAASGVHFLSLFRSSFSARLRGLVGLQNRWRRRVTVLLGVAIGAAVSAANLLKGDLLHDKLVVGFSAMLIICSLLAFISYYPSKMKQLKEMRALAEPSVQLCGHLAGNPNSNSPRSSHYAYGAGEGQMFPVAAAGPASGRTWHAEVRLVVDGRWWSGYGATAHFQVWWKGCSHRSDGGCGCTCAAANAAPHGIQVKDEEKSAEGQPAIPSANGRVLQISTA